MSEVMENIKKTEAFNQKLGGYLSGFEHGKTMAELDAYYEGVLKEIKELEKSLERMKAVGDMYKKMEIKNGKTSRKAVDQGG